jgi:hypothetical protein
MVMEAEMQTFLKHPMNGSWVGCQGAVTAIGVALIA